MTVLEYIVENEYLLFFSIGVGLGICVTIGKLIFRLFGGFVLAIVGLIVLTILIAYFL